MVSSSDIAVQVQSGSLKQDAAEAAFRARYNFGSSEAFKQIFEDIKKTSTIVAPTKDAAPEPVKSDAAVKTTERQPVTSNATDNTSTVRHDDTDSKKDTSTQAASTKPTDKHAHVKKSKGKSVDADNDHDAGKDDKSADTTSAATSTVTDTQTATATDPTAKATDTATADANPTDGATQTTAQTGTQAAPDNTTIANTTGTDDKTKADSTTPTVVTNPSNLAPLLVANLQSDIKSAVGVTADTDIKSAGAEKSAATGKKPATGTLAAANDQDADDAFSAALDAQLGQGKDTKIEAPKENAKTERDANKEANEKHADHLEFLQGNAAAPETHPAAGDRAISAALTASDSPAPTPNGSAGGGSPITKGAAAIAATGAAVTAFEGLHSAQGDQVTFAGTVRSTKEAQASLMSPNEQVAVHLNRMAKSGTSQYDLQLHPADLGRVDIRLEISKDGTVQATITADNQQTFDMLQKDSRSLERALQQAGLQADSGSLSFNLRGDQGNGAQQQAQQNNNGSPWNKWMEKTLPDEVAQSKVLAFDVSSGNGRVDIRL